MRLILTRHGKTFENDRGILQGIMDTKLSPEGIHQAERLAERLANEKIDAIFASDLERSYHTAEIIAKKHPRLKVERLTSYREYNFGSVEGFHKTIVDWQNLPHDVESLDSVLKRARLTLDYIYSRHKNSTVVLVGHGGINRALITIITNKPSISMHTAPGQKNTSVSIFEIGEDKSHKVHLLNCTIHLDPEKKYLKKNPQGQDIKKGDDL